MKIWTRVFILASLVMIVSCSSYEILPNQITVLVGDELLKDKRKMNALDRYRCEDYLHQYLREFAEEYQPRNTLLIETTITDLHLGMGRDMMATETVVKEDGQVIDTLTFQRSTGRRGAAKRLTVALAKDIMSSLRGL